MNQENYYPGMKIKLSIISEDIMTEMRNRSHSCQIPSIYDLAYCLEFVPKLK